VQRFPPRKVDDLKTRGDQRDLKKIAEDCSKATVNCQGLIGTVQEGEFTAQKRSLLPKNARLAVGKTDQFCAVNSQI
jgi:hypothetical protein